MEHIKHLLLHAFLYTFPEEVKGPYDTKLVTENDPLKLYFELKKGRLSKEEIGTLEFMKPNVLDLTFNEKASEKDVEYFQNILKKLTGIDWQRQKKIEENTYKALYSAFKEIKEGSKQESE